MLYKEICADLTRLGYKGMLKAFTEYMELKSLPKQVQEVLSQLIKAEVSHRSARSLLYRLDLARLPKIKSFDNFDLTNLDIDQEKLSGYREFDFIRNRENILLVGGSGTGKTHIALALAYEAIKAMYRTKYLKFGDLTKQMIAANIAGKLPGYMACLQRFDLLIFDEFGYLPLEQALGGLLFELFSLLYESTSIILITHLSFDEWNNMFGSKKSTKAIIDRITHHCHIIETGNKSWRLKSAISQQKQDKKKQPQLLRATRWKH